MKNDRKSGIGILGTGMYLPSRVIDNEQAVTMLASNGVTSTRSGPITAESIYRLTGIKNRHIARVDENGSDMAYCAALRALDKANIKPEDLNFIKVGSSTPERSFPAEACLVAQKLGIKGPEAYDVSAACTSFLVCLRDAGHLLQCEPNYKCGLVIASEVTSRVLDWTDVNSDIWGDGAGAVVIGRVANGQGILATTVSSDGTLAEITDSVGLGTRTGDRNLIPNLWMNGQEIFRYAVRTMVEAAKEIVAKAGVALGDVKLIVPHQANARIITSVAERLEMPIEMFYMNIARCGNTSSASIPIALHQAVMEGKIRPGDLVLLVGLGGGMTAAAILLRW